ncbi:MFS transporter [Ktedonobacteria bacterium brp13]|nr:MFS transporter [Ktedonobacteria bacterium brp13]
MAGYPLSSLEPDSASQEVPEALQAPTQPVSKGFVTALTAANLVIWISVLPVLQLLLPEQVGAIDPVHKTLNLGIVTSIGAFISLIANPIVGALSDRTSSRLGRRRPWILVGALLSALALALLWKASTIVALVIGWSLMQLFSNFLQAATTAIVPDRIPASQRGTITGLVSMATPLGAILGVILIGQVLKSIDISYLFLIALVLVFLLPYTFFLREKVLPRGYLPPFRLGTFLKNFWINPQAYPDFGWAWLARFIVMLGYASATGYTYYYLQDAIHYTRLFPGQTIAQGSSLLSLFSVVFLILSTIVGGMLSDRFQRRKLFVIIASVIMALALFLMGFFPSWPVVIVATCLQGVGFGCYLAVDFVLVTLVLPSEGDRGKDLGILNIANSLPQSLAPLMAGIVLSLTHNSYLIMFVMAGLITLAGAFLVQPIRSVR